MTIPNSPRKDEMSSRAPSSSADAATTASASGQDEAATRAKEVVNLAGLLKPFTAPPAFTPSLVGDTVRLDFSSREEAEAAYGALTALPDALEMVARAVPIWELLGMSEPKYRRLYAASWGVRGVASNGSEPPSGSTNQAVDDGPGTSSSSLQRIAVLERALKPFAAITPSSLYPEDGSENERYTVRLHDSSRHADEHDFTGADLALARLALSNTEEG